MIYTKYFSGVLKHQGVPNLNVEQYARLMNIISLEGRLQELMDSTETVINKDEMYKHYVRMNSLKRQISKLTLDEAPKNVMHSMVIQSN